MLLTPHTFVGVALATSLQNPFIAVPLSFAMHLLGDKVPHWDFYSNSTKEERVKGWRPLAVMADLVTGVAVGLTFTYFVLWKQQNPDLALTIFLSGIASVLPDALEGPYIYMKSEPKLFSYMTKIQRRLQFQAPLPWGLLTQLLVIVFSSLIILKNLGLI
ncbi:hypothetical protein H6802_00510 [Candidatus Nomurabacteria bacterium]|uniref:Uncharacterized protein n=1 Tax=candidate division WWE3 bacterium TaxID=2053526 RepID=A0A955E210_UNCKA|nr:hypothetical protein [candidate division WWE3 bacterium]MCB9823431.1 hypothetical protein [Candidatus Nomurabacteria bacterium]MCB9827713.1 hypothetical protein [Candidatus Nomurabacteria bacterium]HXK52659.1 hypothetical protein [bacterium]